MAATTTSAAASPLISVENKGDVPPFVAGAAERFVLRFAFSSTYPEIEDPAGADRATYYSPRDKEKDNVTRGNLHCLCGGIEAANFVVSHGIPRTRLARSSLTYARLLSPVIFGDPEWWKGSGRGKKGNPVPGPGPSSFREDYRFAERSTSDFLAPIGWTDGRDPDRTVPTRRLIDRFENLGDHLEDLLEHLP